MQTYVICRMYAGTYIENKMGGEIINLLHDDKGDNYIYVNPYGYINKKYDDTVKGVILTRHDSIGCFEVLGIAKIGKDGQLVHPAGNSTKEKMASAGYQLWSNSQVVDITYDGIKLTDILKDSLDGAITFKSDVLLMPKEQIFITDRDHANYIASNHTYHLSDKKFPTQKLISYITDCDNPRAFEAIESIVSDTDLWNAHFKNKVSENTIVDRHFNFLNVIRREDDELVYSNLFYYFFKNYQNLLLKFAEEVLHINLSGDIWIQREEKNIDLWIHDDNNIIVIENKIKSGINGVSPSHNFSENGKVQSQLQKYYEYTEKNKGSKSAHYFIFLPVYNKVDIAKYSGSQYYTKIGYDLLFNFFKGEKVSDKYYDEFVNALYKHTKDRAIDYYEDMKYRFVKQLKSIKARQKQSS